MLDAILQGVTSWTGLLGTIGLTLVGYVSKKFIIPFLQVGRRRHYAEYIATIADDITDELRMKYPEKKWLDHLDEAIDALIAICEVQPEVARRAVKASLGRK